MSSDVSLKMGNHLASNLVRGFPSSLLRLVQRKTRRFNVIPRAEKLIDKIQENPSRAPIHEATQKLVEQLMKENPEKLQELTEKHEDLQKNLQSIYVKSEGENTEIFSKKKFPDSYEYRMMRTEEPDTNVPEGRYNAARAEHFLAAHERDPKVYSAEVLADVYKIDTNAMKNILEYVKIYSVALPMKTTRPPHVVQQMAQDMMPKGLYHEPEMRVLERKVQLAKDKMAKLYKLSHKKKDKLMSDMNLFESLVAMKPMVKKVKEDVMEEVTGAKNVHELSRKISIKMMAEPESKDDVADTSESVDKNVFVHKAKEKLIKYGVLDSSEEIKADKEARRHKAELAKFFPDPNVAHAEDTTVSSPEKEEEDHFALQTKKRLENVLLLETKKKDVEKNKVRSESSSDSATIEETKFDDLKTQRKEKLSDKG